MTSREIAQSLAEYLVSQGWSEAELSRYLAAAEAGNTNAVIFAINKGMTLEELCEGFRMAIRIKKEAAR